MCPPRPVSVPVLPFPAESEHDGAHDVQMKDFHRLLTTAGRQLVEPNLYCICKDDREERERGREGGGQESGRATVNCDSVLLLLSVLPQLFFQVVNSNLVTMATSSFCQRPAEKGREGTQVCCDKSNMERKQAF